MNVEEIAYNFIFRENNNLSNLHSQLHQLLYKNVKTTDAIASTLIDSQLLNEIKFIHTNSTDVSLYFGKTLREIKCVITGDDCIQEYEILLKYHGPKKLSVSYVNLPDSPLQYAEYKTIDEVIIAFKKYIQNLTNYFYALERIDQICAVMEPTKPSFKEEYRRIFIDDRTWLHFEVTKDGLATNVHLIGQCEMWQDKLQQGLLTWDHDKEIVDNIMDIFGFKTFPVPQKNQIAIIEHPIGEVICSICLCSTLPDNSSMPQPLCQSQQCGVYFHQNCLFQWLVACSGGRLPTFGVISGSCPSCFQPITCKAKDD